MKRSFTSSEYFVEPFSKRRKTGAYKFFFVVSTVLAVEGVSAFGVEALSKIAGLCKEGFSLAKPFLEKKCTHFNPHLRVMDIFKPAKAVIDFDFGYPPMQKIFYKTRWRSKFYQVPEVSSFYFLPLEYVTFSNCNFSTFEHLNLLYFAPQCRCLTIGPHVGLTENSMIRFPLVSEIIWCGSAVPYFKFRRYLQTLELRGEDGIPLFSLDTTRPRENGPSSHADEYLSVFALNHVSKLTIDACGTDIDFSEVTPYAEWVVLGPRCVQNADRMVTRAAQRLEIDLSKHFLLAYADQDAGCDFLKPAITFAKSLPSCKKDDETPEQNTERLGFIRDLGKWLTRRVRRGGVSASWSRGKVHIVLLLKEKKFYY